MFVCDEETSQDIKSEFWSDFLMLLVEIHDFLTLIKLIFEF